MGDALSLGRRREIHRPSLIALSIRPFTRALERAVARREPVDLRGIARESVVRFDREIVGKGMWSAVRDRLTETGPETTLWVSENEFRFSGFLMRLVGLLMPGAFRKQSLQHMRDFKAFAERGQDVREGRSGSKP